MKASTERGHRHGLNRVGEANSDFLFYTSSSELLAGIKILQNGGEIGKTQVTGSALRFSNLVGLEMGLTIYISNKFPGLAGGQNSNNLVLVSGRTVS